MRRVPLLTAMPEAVVKSLAELYAIAFYVTQQAIPRYGALASRIDPTFQPIRAVFDVLAARERERADKLSADCLAACGRTPSPGDLRWTPVDLVPVAELADIGDSELSTPFTAWALAVMHRQRAFVFWTYVIAGAKDPQVRRAAENLAHEALSDGDRLRRERRLAWKAERQTAASGSAATDEADASASSALLESLLLRDILAWAHEMTAAQRQQVTQLDISRLPSNFMTLPQEAGPNPAVGDIEQIKRRALRRAEQLSNIYLDDANSAPDQDSMELAQRLAAQAITRLANLRHLASESKPQ
ncbi:MAG: hypothetical protein ABJA75_05125 [Bradyrhizobium sp.]